MRLKNLSFALDGTLYVVHPLTAKSMATRLTAIV
jgi:hypothetical protein